MKQMTVRVAVLLAVVTAVGCKDNESKTPNKVALADVPDGFSKYENSDGGFSVMAPGLPKVDRATTTETDAGKIVGNGVRFTLPHDGALSVLWMDGPVVPTGAQKSMFDTLRDSFSDGLQSEREIILDGRPGREWMFEIPVPPMGKATNRVRTYLDGTRFYILQAQLVPGARPTDSMYFLDSFEFTDQKNDSTAQTRTEPEHENAEEPSSSPREAAMPVSRCTEWFAMITPPGSNPSIWRTPTKAACEQARRDWLDAGAEAAGPCKCSEEGGAKSGNEFPANEPR